MKEPVGERSSWRGEGKLKEEAELSSTMQGATSPEQRKIYS